MALQAVFNAATESGLDGDTLINDAKTQLLDNGTIRYGGSEAHSAISDACDELNEYFDEDDDDT